MTHNRAQSRALLERHRLAPRRSRGQNFVVDPNTVRRIAEMARLTSGQRVIEIGPGLGALTLALAQTGARVTAVEIDHGLVELLREEFADEELITIVEADALTLDWSRLIAPDETAVLVANLPYNIATPLIVTLLAGVPALQRMLVMVQREVAERLSSPAGSDAYGGVSVKIAYWADAHIVGHVPATVFMPRPKVESSLVEIVRHAPPSTDYDALTELVNRAFSQRRKMLRRSLADIVDAAMFAAAGIDATTRPEQLDIHAWCRLSDTVQAHRVAPEQR